MRQNKLVRVTAEQYEYIHNMLLSNLEEWKTLGDEIPSFVIQESVDICAKVLDAFEAGTTKVEPEPTDLQKLKTCFDSITQPYKLKVEDGYTYIYIADGDVFFEFNPDGSWGSLP